MLAWEDDRDEARRLKKAILAISHGIELLLKERLRKIHPSLIWENVEKYPSLSARTVNTDSAVIKLKNIGNIKFTKDDQSLINSIRDTRNAIEHFQWSASKQEANVIVGQALGFSFHFAKEQLGHDFVGYHSRKDDTFEALLENNPYFATAFRSRFENAAKEQGVFFVCCDFCHAVAANPATGACSLCGHWNNFGLNEIPF